VPYSGPSLPMADTMMMPLLVISQTYKQTYISSEACGRATKNSRTPTTEGISVVIRSQSRTFSTKG
jgi:hypothetical protein